MSRTKTKRQRQATQSDMTPVAAAPASRSVWNSVAQLDRRHAVWVVLVVAALLYSQSHFWTQPALGDRANWDYFAQVIARGGVPYRDVVNIKSPLSAYLGAAAIIAARPTGLRDIFAIRIFFLLLAALTVAMTFLLALEAFDNLRVALLAAAAFLLIDNFARFNSSGVQPKTPMILFGLVSLWALLKDRPFAAGLFGMLSALSWQPGLLFAGAAGLAASRYLTSWRDRRALKVIAGAVVPLFIMLLYFWMAGALKDFYLWNFHFTATVYAPRESRTLGDFFDHFAKLMRGPYKQSRWLFYTAIAGLAVALWQQWQRTRQGRRFLDDAPRQAVLIAGLVYFVFCMVDIQGPMDLIPLLPFITILAAVAIDFALERLTQLAAQARWQTRRAAMQRWATAMVIAAMLYLAATQATPAERASLSLADQDAVVAGIVAQLQPGDKVFTHGVPELLVLGQLTNASKYFLLDRGKDVYLDRVEAGGFAGWLERLKAERPKIIALSRFADVAHETDFQLWAAADYVPQANRVLTYYVRKGD
jgi:hypothetical protein